MTGDTANGRSMSVIKVLLPRNSNLAIAQAAATPNTRLKGTAMAATVSVSLTAAQAIGVGDRGERKRADALGQRLDEHREQRQHQKQAPGTRAPRAISSRPAGLSARARWTCASAAAMSRQGPMLQRVDAEHEREGQTPA